MSKVISNKKELELILQCLDGSFEEIATRLSNYFNEPWIIEIAQHLVTKKVYEFKKLVGTDEIIFENLEHLKEIVDFKTFTLKKENFRSKITSIKKDIEFIVNQPVVGWGPLTFLIFSALRKVMPTQKSAVVMTCRNEGIYLLEWISFYKAIGFNHLFIYSNDNDDFSDELLDELSNHKLITFIRNENTGKHSVQQKAYEHSIHLLPELRDFEWVLYADADEFLIPAQKYNSNIDNLLNDISSLNGDLNSCVLFNWKWMTSNYTLRREPGGVLERFPHGRDDRGFKSLVKLKDVVSMRAAHFPILLNSEDGIYLDGNLKVIEGIDPPEYKTLWSISTPKYLAGQLNHYWCKSYEEFVIKQDRRKFLFMEGAPKSRKELKDELFFTWNGVNTAENKVDITPSLQELINNNYANILNKESIGAVINKIEASFLQKITYIENISNINERYKNLDPRRSL